MDLKVVEKKVLMPVKAFMLGFLQYLLTLVLILFMPLCYQSYVKNIGEAVNNNTDLGIGAVSSILLSWSILLSSNLGLMNLLPLPALDGGRLMFILIEAIRSKRINPEKEAFIHATGFILLMILMVFVFFNDIKAIL